jgi:hypothetical protein
LDTKRINQLIAENVTRYSREERLRILAAVSRQMKKLPTNVPVAIPAPETMQTTLAFSKKALLTMEHDARLQLLDQLIPQSMWGTEKHRALLEEMQIDSVHVTKRNSIQVKFTLEHFKGTSEEMALLDTGATESFIDHESVLHLKLGT